MASNPQFPVGISMGFFYCHLKMDNWPFHTIPDGLISRSAKSFLPWKFIMSPSLGATILYVNDSHSKHRIHLKNIFNNHPILNATPGFFKSISHLFKFSHYVSNITNIPSQRFLQSFLRRTLKNRCGRPLARNRRSPCSALFFDLWGRGASCKELCGLHIGSTCLSTYLSTYLPTYLSIYLGV